MLEIEKTFLVKKIPVNLGKYQSKKIKQGYFSKQPSPLRIRQKDDKFEITKKIPLRAGDFQAAEEINIPLKTEEFELLWPQIIAALVKTRYLIPLADGLTAELDVFEGPLSGLAFVEVEFENEAACESFIAPDWFGADVTQEQFSSNAFLADKTYAEIETLINEKKGE